MTHVVVSVPGRLAHKREAPNIGVKTDKQAPEITRSGDIQSIHDWLLPDWKHIPRQVVPAMMTMWSYSDAYS
ncbi:hypothetical protein [Actinoplanes sp. TFC3]|uniref:hypothetical protein n=1 Tax=Actinoplanes sp. TFC3 TaxID=1710355 RepID=UPI0012901639|nr:hypothetical protein [Actinoplanes sp. TFC3]